MISQKLSLSLFFAGLGTFLTSLGELLSQHNDWHQLSSPHEIGSIILITGSFVVTVVGALGTDLPRDKNTRIGDKLGSVDINKVEKENINEN